MHFLHTLTCSAAATALMWDHPDKGWNTTAHGTGPTAISTGSLLRSTSTPSPHVVAVGVGASGEMGFSPNTLTALPGTVLRFDFSGLNYTLVQSFEKPPCLTGSQSDVGLNQSILMDVNSKFLVDYTVRTLDQMWFYCKQTIAKSRCEEGSVFSLNSRILSSVTAGPSLPVSSPESHYNTLVGMPTTAILNTTNPRPTSIPPELSNMGYNWKVAFPNLLGLIALNLV
jgi:plastocyanin